MIELRVEHVALYVKDLEAAKQFFTDVLGGKAGAPYHNPKTGFRSCFVTFEGARVELMTRPGLTDDENAALRTGYAHLCFSLGRRSAVDELTEKLRLNGFEVLSGPRVTGDGYYESCIAIVEGIPIELTE